MTLEAAPPRPVVDLRVIFGATLAVIIAVLALVSLAWTPHGAASLTPLAEPDASHWIGTDAIGRDGTSVLMAATLTTLLLSVFGTLASLFVGIPIGVALALRLPATRHTAHAIGMLPPALLIGMVVSGLAAPANLTLFLAIAILIEVSLSFAGLGVLSPGASLGLMLRDSQQVMTIRPLLILVPGAVAVITSLALMLAASGLRGVRHGA